MPTNIVTTLDVKSHDEPDEARRPEKSEIDIVTVGDYTIGRFTFDPGWSWSECIKPVVHTDSCQNNHVGYCVAGTLEVRHASGETATIRAGDSYTIPPGHDARVVGDEKFVGIEFLSAAVYAKPA
ncbi:cupin domain-containing protein [Sinomonas sp. JGH33]|uniref:Cupin domain-containing protein n=1 Tax=Sinomonas terricola TaxID=3110330 RepID=A0ABU5T8D5_9MICC|nr:cupin domain-containing protein [Sinomonas sp. JGH33]MEA5455938.1 cupin domain-containing protein [Sinomonas sp. JGH33]